MEFECSAETGTWKEPIRPRKERIAPEKERISPEKERDQPRKELMETGKEHSGGENTIQGSSDGMCPQSRS